MSEAERTEEATPKRREDARREGRIPKSQELAVAAGLLGGAVVLGITAPAMAAALLGIMGGALASAGTVNIDASSATTIIQTVGAKALVATMPLMLAFAAISLFVGGAQSGGNFTFQALAPNFAKLNPASNIKRMVGLQPWAELLKSVLKLIIVGLAVKKSLGAAWPDVIALAQSSPLGLAMVLKKYALRLLSTAGFSYLVLALADYAWQRWQYSKSLMMSREEIKQENRQSEGDPMVKARMRAIGRQLARKRMFRDVPTADVVIANPTHIAIALRYDPDVSPAPFVVAMGERKVAERIKAIAFEHGVPVIENRPLARALIASAKLGTTIPAELYMAVAEVLAFVLRQRALRPSRPAWQGAALA